MARSRLRSGTRNISFNKNVWKYTSFQPHDNACPYLQGQILHVYPQNTDLKYVPCIPKPESGTTKTRLEEKIEITFLGMVELLYGAKAMHFLINSTEEQVYIGLGSLPHLCNIPKRPTAGFNSRPKRKTKRKSPSLIAKVQAKKRSDGRKLSNKG